MIFKVGIRILVAITIGVSVFAVKAFLFRDRARSAQTGDCIQGTGSEVTGETVTRAEKVDCGSAEAEYTVAGRINGVTDVNSPDCAEFFADHEKYTVYASAGDGGYLLCLRPKAS